MPEPPEPKKPLRAVALGYARERDAAPRVVARGQGELAQRILERAAEHDVPVERDPDLLQCLQSLEVGMQIPIEAYVAVARVLALLYRINGQG